MDGNPIDSRVIAQLRELQDPDEPDLVQSLIALFFTEGQERIDRILAAARAGDAATIERAAHSLKGSAGTIGARRLSAACAALEAAAPGDAADHVNTVTREYAAAVDALRALQDWKTGRLED